MGEYRSVTEPVVRKQGVSEAYTNREVEAVGTSFLTKRIRQDYGIPRKVKPTIIRGPLGEWVWSFNWYSVQTFN